MHQAAPFNTVFSGQQLHAPYLLELRIENESKFTFLNLNDAKIDSNNGHSHITVEQGSSVVIETLRARAWKRLL